MDIHVSNLSPDTTREDLRKAFSTHGTVSAVTILTEKRSCGRKTGASKGYGFVIMPDNKTAQAAVAALDRHDLRGCPMKVQKALPTRFSRRRR